jgi:hypothetical protein
MSTPKCQVCAHWARHHSLSEFGRCIKLLEAEKRFNHAARESSHVSTHEAGHCDKFAARAARKELP